jgi:hypothetical protein
MVPENILVRKKRSKIDRVHPIVKKNFKVIKNPPSVSSDE